jgi:replication factor C subunit 1
MAILVASSLGYQPIEMNASDTRTKKSIHEELADATLSCHAYGPKRLIIMDEVDGMGGSDRGGVAELIQVIKTSKIPILCICNDRQSASMRSLAQSCFELRVKRPNKTQIVARLLHIARAEGLAFEPNAAEMLVEQTGNDIRQAIHTMQVWRNTDIKTSGQKDSILRKSPFDACATILEGKQSLDDRYQSVFIDYSLVPLLVQQNYIDYSKTGIFKDSRLSNVQQMNQLAMVTRHTYVASHTYYCVPYLLLYPILIVV